MTLKEIISKVWDRTKVKLEPLEKVYQSQYLTLEGSFSTNNSEEWIIALNGKSYNPTTRDFKILLDSPLILTPTTFEDKYSRLILPKGTTVAADMSNVFSNMTNIKILDISGVDWSNATDMSGSFVGFPKDAQLIGIESFYTTGNVTNFANHGIFEYNPDAPLNMHSLQYLLRDNFNGIEGNIKLGKYDLTNADFWYEWQQGRQGMAWDFEGSNVRPTVMQGAFSNVTSLPLNLAELDTSRCIKMWECFKNCNIGDQEFPDLGKWDTSKVAGPDFGHMFDSLKCGSTVLNVPFDVSSATDLTQMFYNIKSGIKVINCQFKNMQNLKKTAYLFYNSTSIEEINFGPNFDLTNTNNGSVPCSETWGIENTLKRATGVYKFSKHNPWIEIKFSQMDLESAMVFINGIPDITVERPGGEETVHIHANIYDQLSEEVLAEIIAKGWNISRVGG